MEVKELNEQDLSAMKNRINSRLGDPNLSVYLYNQIDSTNDECKRKCLQGIHKCLVMAESQTKGRGRIGKEFFSPKGGLYLSILIPSSTNLGELTCRVAVETAESIESLCGLSCGIKWVNDLFFHGKKVGGILTESLNNSVIIGIGINLLPVTLPDHLTDIAGFLDCSDIREELAVEISSRLLSPRYNRMTIMEHYRERSIVLGKEIICIQGATSFSAKAVSIDEQGGLEIVGPNGAETLFFGEVSIRENPVLSKF